MRLNNKYKINLLNFNEKSMINLFKFFKEKKFNIQQINNWIHKKNILNINLISNIKKTFKERLTNLFDTSTLNITKEYFDKDNTIKWLIKTKDEKIIEIVAMPNSKNHFTLCLSSQVGCALKCSFCATGKNGFTRNLKTYEIVNQFIIANTKINKIFPNKKITNIVMMGMGEPLLNINNVLSFISIITNKDSFNLSKNKITVSTSGIIENIKKIAENNIPLAISLHFTNNKIRSNIMPINKKYPLNKLIKECKKYDKKIHITIEYIMIKNINDSINDANSLINLLKNMKCKICLIPFNKIDDTIYKTPDFKTIYDFQKRLIKNGFITNIRKKRGSNINAACGQLAGLIR